MAQISNVPTVFEFETLIKNVLGVLARFVGLAIFVALLIGGYQYLTAAGDPKKAEQAQKTITIAVTGAIIIIFFWFFLNILEQVTGVTLTTFSICLSPPCS